MQALLAEIDYDFSRFEMEGFARWLERRRGRRVLFVPWRMPASVSGIWLADPDFEFVFYEQHTPPLHQSHIQLHEMAHMLCGHSTLEIGPQQVHVLLRQTAADPAFLQLLLCSPHSREVDLEAEMLASLIQERVLHHHRLRELTRAVPSDAADLMAYLGSYLEGVELS
jgi:hypothetical protein